jgi:hypothetical protein
MLIVLSNDFYVARNRFVSPSIKGQNHMLPTELPTFMFRMRVEQEPQAAGPLPPPAMCSEDRYERF